MTDANTLLEAARCFRCIPRGVQAEVIISEIDKWAEQENVLPWMLGNPDENWVFGDPNTGDIFGQP